MAGDWIKMRVDLATDPAVISISCALGITEFEVVGMLHHFWSWADAQSRDGHAAGVTKTWVDRYVHHAGFAEQLESVGWLLCSDAGIEIPNFGRHNGASAKSRGLAKDRQKNLREKKSREPSRSERDNSVTREEIEKRLKEQTPCPQQADDGHKFRFAEIQDAYNRICAPTLPACRAANEARKRQVKRMVDLEFNGKRPFRERGLVMWESYFADCLTNKHWVGENDRGWRADFDHVTNPKNAIKLLERICG